MLDCHTTNVVKVAQGEHLGLIKSLTVVTVNHSIHRLEVNVIRAGLGSLFEALLVTLPALEELLIRFCSPERYPWPHEQFSAFRVVTRSKCPLKASSDQIFFICPTVLPRYNFVLTKGHEQF
ncbi:hypothetical protein EDB19DRAFT_78973 [Suillus lakei]|nr:hypothetical protein EDB19DRAFT_78973 [Suillus lakei]